jgi:hypothetical protein
MKIGFCQLSVDFPRIFFKFQNFNFFFLSILNKKNFKSHKMMDWHEEGTICFNFNDQIYSTNFANLHVLISVDFFELFDEMTREFFCDFLIRELKFLNCHQFLDFLI